MGDMMESVCLHTCLVVEHPLQLELTGYLARASIRAEGPLSGADLEGVLLDITVLWLFVP